MHKEPCISKIKYEDFCRETQIFLPSRLDVFIEDITVGICKAGFAHIRQAVWEPAQYAPALVRRTLHSSSSPYTPYACGAQRTLLHEYS